MVSASASSTIRRGERLGVREDAGVVVAFVVVAVWSLAESPRPREVERPRAEPVADDHRKSGFRYGDLGWGM